MNELLKLSQASSVKGIRMIDRHLKAYRQIEEVPKTLDFFNRISAFSKKQHIKPQTNGLK